MSQYSPATYGLASGTSSDGSTIYPGIGSFSTCGGGTVPAKITTSGAYASCSSSTEVFDLASAQFFANDPKLKWIQTTGSYISTVNGAIAVGNSGGFNVYVGRYNVFVNGAVVRVIGKVWKDGIYYADPTKLAEVKWTSSFEILACNECASGGNPPYCCKLI